MSTLLNKNVIVHYIVENDTTISEMKSRIELYQSNCVSTLSADTSYVNIYVPTVEVYLQSGIVSFNNTFLTNTGSSYKFLVIHNCKVPYAYQEITQVLAKVNEYKSNYMQFGDYTDVIEIVIPSFSNSRKIGIEIIPLVNI